MEFFPSCRSAISGTGLCKNDGHSNFLQLSDLLIVYFFCSVFFFFSRLVFQSHFGPFKRGATHLTSASIVYRSIDVPTIRVGVPIQFIID